MKKKYHSVFIALFASYSALAQTKTVTVNANDELNNNTKIVAVTDVGQSFFTGHQFGYGYAYPNGIFRAMTDNATGSSNYYFDGLTSNGSGSYLRNFSVRADGQGFFAGDVGIGTAAPRAKFHIDPQGAGGITIGTDDGHTAGLTTLMMGISAQYSGYSWLQSIRGAGGDWGTLALNSSGGNVGIGTSSPGDQLVVNGAIRTTVNSPSGYGSYGGGLVAFDQSSGGNNIFSLVRQTNNLAISAWGGIGFTAGAFSPSTNYQMYLNSAGQVGIGTQNPTAKLTIAGSGNLNPNPGAETDYNGLSLAFKGESNGSNFNLGTIKMVQPAGSYLDNADMVFSTCFQNTTEKMRITGQGYVGIGTTTPGDQLVVNGAIRTNVNSPSGYGSYGGGLVAFDQSSGGNNIFSLVRQANNLAITAGEGIGFTAGVYSPSTNYQMFITPGGTVGIGTTDPKGYKLAVNGSIIGTSVVVKAYPWPDYVFNTNYQLLPLQDVKAYIDQNHRLPEMPSDKEVADKGLDLGEINKLLTKKVEELTLYLIDQQKQMKEMNQLQQKQIDDLKKELRSLKKDQ